MQRGCSPMMGQPRASAPHPETEAVGADFLVESGPCLLARWDAHQAFWDERLAMGLDPFQRTGVEGVGPVLRVVDRGGVELDGVNFASQDYLSLSAHPQVQNAAIAAIARFGLHSAGSRAL